MNGPKTSQAELDLDNISIVYWQDRIFDIAEAHGWWDRDAVVNLPEKISLMHSELSEALEEIREGRPGVWTDTNGKPEGWAIELIDCVIRIFDTLAFFSYDAAELIAMKSAYNNTRPYKHGKLL